MHADASLPDGGGRLLYVVGPSGAGKDTVLRAWRDGLPPHAPVAFAQRIITRRSSRHPHAEQHEAVDEVQMERLLVQGLLALHWRANGLHYGVRRTLLAPMERGQWLVLNGSRGQLQALRRLAPRARVVLVTASSPTLAARLALRGRESASEIERRLLRAAALGESVAADCVIRNEGRVEEAAERLHAWWQSLASPALTAGIERC
ncbi:phosphonate metabolism protein/1,5-bisphosphokinase (PRPP-forming) PhnN [Schlegelella sp. S2-27]|uniref:Phosphonate metabolism protein/1,5-bisphosphokinase (PRPP-forming) PhnN n=1 Tax=Caldimonas mangrovi TaxID=2944811 RepID=A0ABT0YVU1_9BURK|nr:phosphonate metabolism protein/1,5-bisphosphokinase (PRPP-forming) PhnN [Caldimonas mangrovi]MCM5682868.1 phosphonate metabolism protein/1,5-bisphosphokinase (PRPP-forming) PhnN [Caldimonas mangrovi]